MKTHEEMSDDELVEVTGGLVPGNLASRAAKERCDKLSGNFAADPGLHRTLLGDAHIAYLSSVAGIQIADGSIPLAPRGVPQTEVTFDIDTY